MSEETAARVLPQFLGIFVPLEIMCLEERGGPTPEELATAVQFWIDTVDIKGDKGQGGAELLYVTPGKTAEAAGKLVRLIACLAFQSGGIQFLGHHFVAYEPHEEPTP